MFESCRISQGMCSSAGRALNAGFRPTTDLKFEDMTSQHKIIIADGRGFDSRSDRKV